VYVDLGCRYLEERDKQYIQRHLVGRLAAFGSVKLQAATWSTAITISQQRNTPVRKIRV
jgi:hypothetical protein